MLRNSNEKMAGKCNWYSFTTSSTPPHESLTHLIVQLRTGLHPSDLLALFLGEFHGNLLCRLLLVMNRSTGTIPINEGRHTLRAGPCPCHGIGGKHGCGHEAGFVRQLPNTEGLETTDTTSSSGGGIGRASAGSTTAAAAAAKTGGLASSGQCTAIGHNYHTAHEDTPITGLGTFDHFVPHDNIDASGHTSRWNFGRILLHPKLLPIAELTDGRTLGRGGLVHLQQKFVGSVVPAAGVATYDGTGEVELLANTLGQQTALVAAEVADDELRTDVAGTGDRAADGGEASDAIGPQMTEGEGGGQVVKGHKVGLDGGRGTPRRWSAATTSSSRSTVGIAIRSTSPIGTVVGIGQFGMESVQKGLGSTAQVRLKPNMVGIDRLGQFGIVMQEVSKVDE